MKIKHLFLLLASAAFVALSCEKNNENKPEEKDTTPVPEISVITTAFPSIADAGGTLEVTISSNVDWTVSIPEAADWLSANPTSGAAGEEITITFTATANEGYDKRTATVTVSGENKKGSDSEEFAISQKQKDALILSDDVIEVGYEGGTINVVLQANSDISYAIAEDAQSWIVPVQPNAAPTRALVESTISFQVLANTVKEAREGVITFTNAAGDETVTVKQEALPEPDPELAITPASIADVEVAGAAVKLTLTSNMPWVVSIPDGVNWLTVSPTQGEAGENVEVTVTIQANDANDGRTTDLTFTCTNAENESKDVVIKVTQKGLNIPSNISISSAAELIAFATSYNAGTYAPVIDKLAVTLTGDVTFDETSSAAFPGIGSTANAFKGAFDGANHTISGFVGTAPMFPFIAAGASVKNLTIDNTCSFTFTHPNTDAVNFGSVVGYLDGALENVKVAADVSLAAVEEVAFGTNLGGIAGQAWTGSIKNCEYSGLISTPAGFTIKVPADDTSNRKLIIGGLAGFIGGSGSVDQSYFKGAICNEALVEAVDVTNRFLKNTPYLIIGGVVGYLDGDATVNGTNTTADHATIQSAHTGATSVGHIVNKTTIAFNSVVGGIVGENNSGTVSQCDNAAAIFNTIFKTGADISRYMKTGGIVGKNNADGVIDGCKNTEKIQHRSNPKLQDIAGIAGYNAGTVKNCINSGEVNHMTTGVSGASNKGGRIVNIAGIIGENAAGATVSNVSNTANIQISAMEDGTGSEARMGGVVAYNLADIDGGASKSITNSGQVYFNNNFTKQFLGYELGGVVGFSTGSVKNVKNSGYVVLNWNSDANVASKIYLGGIIGKMHGDGAIDGCVNEGGENHAGEVFPSVKAGSAGHNNIFAGGIVGYAGLKTVTVNDEDTEVSAAVAISNCSNSGYVHGGNATKVNGKPFYVGGIVAYLTGASSIADCTNTGKLLNDQFNNTVTAAGSTFEGGMAGFVQGSAENRISISNANNTLAGIGGRRGYNGGIVGYAEYADITNSTSTGSYTGGSGYYIGGLAGWLVNSTISSSTYNGELIESSQIQAAGGIVAVLDAGSVVDGCYSKLATITHGSNACVDGAIAGKSVAGSTIKNCHYKSGLSFDICSDSNFTAGEGEEANKADIE